MKRSHLLIIIGIAAAIGIGIFAVTREDSQADAQDAFCSSLQSMESDVQALLALQPTSASQPGRWSFFRIPMYPSKPWTRQDGSCGRPSSM